MIQKNERVVTHAKANLEREKSLAYALVVGSETNAQLTQNKKLNKIAVYFIHKYDKQLGSY